jgi:hypothetical protein
LPDAGSEATEASYTREGRALMEPWILRNHRETCRAVRDIGSFLVRCENYALKIAMLVQLSLDYSATIDVEAVETALRLVDHQKQVIEALVGMGAPVGLEQACVKVRGHLADNGGQTVSRSELLRATRVSADDLDQVLEYLGRSGELRRSGVEITGRARPKHRGPRPKPVRYPRSNSPFLDP